MAKGRAIVPPTKSGAQKSKSSGKSRSSFSRVLPWIAGAIVAVAVIAGLVLLVQSNTASASAPGERMPVQGRDHIEVGASHPPYSSDPPTSGPHYDGAGPGGLLRHAAARRRTHPQPGTRPCLDRLRLQQADRLREQAKQQLRQLVASYKQWKIVVTPRQNKDAPIALAAWGWLQKLNNYDEPSIRRFVDAWRDKGPEQTME